MAFHHIIPNLACPMKPTHSKRARPPKRGCMAVGRLPCPRHPHPAALLVVPPLHSLCFRLHRRLRRQRPSRASRVPNRRQALSRKMDMTHCVVSSRLRHPHHRRCEMEARIVAATPTMELLHGISNEGKINRKRNIASWIQLEENSSSNILFHRLYLMITHVSLEFNSFPLKLT